jgi:hypothetical protein
MDDRSSLDRLRGDLLRRGLPPHYIERVVGELDDHRADIVEAGQGFGLDADGAVLSAAERLGHPSRLAEVVASQYRARTFFGRHPVVTFLVGPIPIALLGWIFVYGLGFSALLPLREAIVQQTSFAAWEGLCRSMDIVARYVLPGAVTVLFCRLAYRSGRGWPWLCAACILLALLNASFQSSMKFSPEPEGSSLSFGFGTSLHLLPMMVPLAIGALFAWRLESPRRLAAA